MSRIETISDPKNGPMAELFEKSEALMGFLPNDALQMAHKPELLKAFFVLVNAVYGKGKVDNGLKRLVGHLSSKVAGCRYCSAHTSFGADKQGVSKEKLEAVWEFESSTLFSEKEKAALNLSLKGSMVPNQTTEEDFDRLKKHFDAEAIVEIMGVISMFGFLNRWNSTFDTELETQPKAFYETLNSSYDG